MNCVFIIFSNARSHLSHDDLEKWLQFPSNDKTSLLTYFGYLTKSFNSQWNNYVKSVHMEQSYIVYVTNVTVAQLREAIINLDKYKWISAITTLNHIGVVLVSSKNSSFHIYYLCLRCSTTIILDELTSLDLLQPLKFQKMSVIMYPATRWNLRDAGIFPLTSAHLGITDLIRYSSINPFSQKINQDNNSGTANLNFHMAHILSSIFLSANTTIQHNCGIDFKLANDCVIKWGRQMYQTPHFTLIQNVLSYQAMIQHSDKYLIRQEGLTFFTCYKETNLSFQIYVAPFQTELWVAILITLATVLTFANFVIRFCITGSEIEKNRSSSVVALFLCATLFEESYIFEKSNKSIWTSSTLRFVFTLWLLLCILLTNTFLGIFIMKLSSPLPPLKKYEYFIDLLTYPQHHETADQGQLMKESLRVWEIGDASIGLNFQSNITTQASEHFVFLTPQIKTTSPRHVVNYKFWHTIHTFLLDVVNYVDFASHRGFRNLLGISLHVKTQKFPPFSISTSESVSQEFALEELITQCHKKYAYIEYEGKVMNELEYLTEYYPSNVVDFTLAKESILYEYIYALFEQSVSKVPKNFVKILESGIYKKILQARESNFRKLNKGVVRTRQNVKDLLAKIFKDGDQAVNAMALSGSIQTVFIIWGVLLAVSFLWSLVEMYFK
ncbi:hypothetical protein Fcan01_01643 [Folsomia candida]|uniref:Uncharacterized protein n=2 Tax=Folsomia candida TaxID=158441 RepID=A0A226EWC8_FOLCA|nr:hypothetical protein Fcan01_01643 [Folsomia candida]